MACHLDDGRAEFLRDDARLRPTSGREPSPKTSYDLSSLRILESGGAYVGAETLARMETLFGARFLPVWGCTEATGVALANGPDERVPGATGRAVPGYDVKVVDSQGRTLQSGETGELVIRGPSVANGYINNPDETAALFKDGWYHTCDLVIQDEKGFIHFQGRRSEMLKIGGIRVYPLEIEKGNQGPSRGPGCGGGACGRASAW